MAAVKMMAMAVLLDRPHASASRGSACCHAVPDAPAPDVEMIALAARECLPLKHSWKARVARSVLSR
jgi:hypothetical protein